MDHASFFSEATLIEIGVEYKCKWSEYMRSNKNEGRLKGERERL